MIPAQRPMMPLCLQGQGGRLRWPDAAEAAAGIAAEAAAEAAVEAAAEAAVEAAAEAVAGKAG